MIQITPLHIKYNPSIILVQSNKFEHLFSSTTTWNRKSKTEYISEYFITLQSVGIKFSK